MQVRTHAADRFHIIPGGRQVEDKKPRAFHHEHQGFTVTFKGDGKTLWTIDWSFWEGTTLAERPPVVALATLGFSPSEAHLTPGEARDILLEALERHGEQALELVPRQVVERTPLVGLGQWLCEVELSHVPSRQSTSLPRASQPSRGERAKHSR